VSSGVAQSCNRELPGPGRELPRGRRSSGVEAPLKAGRVFGIGRGELCRSHAVTARGRAGGGRRGGGKRVAGAARCGRLSAMTRIGQPLCLVLVTLLLLVPASEGAGSPGENPARAVEADLAGGRAKEALEASNRLLAANPRDGELYLLRAKARFKLGDAAGGLADLHLAVQHAPDNAEAWFQRGTVLLSQKTYADAVKDLDRSLALRPDPTAFATRGLANLLLGRNDRALADLNESLRLRPRHSATLADRGLARERLGDRNGAESDYQSALKLDSKNTRASSRLERLEKAPPSGPLAYDSAARGKAPAADSPSTNPVVISVESPSTAGTTAPPRPGAGATPVPTAVAPAPRTPAAEGAPGALLPPLRLDFTQLEGLAYQAALSAVVEAMRLLQSPTKPDQIAAFNRRWDPLFLQPSPELNDYLNRLNPPLQDFVAARSALAQAAADHDRALEESAFAIAHGNRPATEAALREVANTQGLLRFLRNRIAFLALQVAEHGDPPVDAASRRRTRHQEAVKVARRLGPAAPGDAFLRVSWERIPEGWLQQLHGIGSTRWVHLGGSLFREPPPIQPGTNPLAAVREQRAFLRTEGILTPQGQRHVLLRDNAERAAFNRKEPEDPSWAIDDHKSGLVLTYRGVDLSGFGHLVVRVNLARVRLSSAADLALHRAARTGAHLSRSTRAGSFGGYPTYEYVEHEDMPDSGGGTSYERIADYRVIAVDLGRASDNLWAVIRVESGITTEISHPYASPAEAQASALHRRMLADRIGRRLDALLDSLELSFVEGFPEAEYVRLERLAKELAAKAHPQPATISEPPPGGYWVLREVKQDGERFVQQTAAALGSRGESRFRFTWQPPPARLEPGATVRVRVGAECLNPRDKSGSMSYPASAHASEARILGGASLPQIEIGDSTAGEPRARAEAEISVPVHASDRGGTTGEISFSHGISQVGSGTVTYVYAWIPVPPDDDPRLYPLVIAGLAGSARSGGGVVAQPTAPATPDPRETAAKTQRLAEIRAGIGILARLLEREQAELARETDPKRAQTLQFRILGVQSDLLAEQDLARSLETGTLVHTRSPFDDYARGLFLQSCEREARRADQALRLTKGAERLVRLLPADEAAAARAFLERQLTPEAVAKGEVEALRRAVGAVNEKVLGYWEGQRAKAALDEAKAQFALDAATNIKTGADLGLTFCALLGGEPINYFYQGVTGYLDGGVVQATKAIVTTWSDCIDYAATGYDEYRRGGPEAAAGSLAMKFLQKQAFTYFANRIGPLTLGTAPGASPYRPTLRERFDAARFREEWDLGRALVDDFNGVQRRLLAAGQRGAPADEIQALQRLARDKAAALASSLPAKNHLKYAADPEVGAAYDTHMRVIHADVDFRTKELMRQRGWNVDDWELRDFRNASSEGRPNMDRDVGLREGPALTREGRPSSLHQWQEEAGRAYAEAYRQVTGRSSRLAQETVTTSIHPEAYKDLAWLGDNPSSAARAWAAQAADVTRYKAGHMLAHGDPGASHFVRLQEVARGTAKDMQTKLLPLIRDARPQGSSAASRQASAEALARSQRHWQEIQQVLQAFGQNQIDPLAAARRIRELTGGRSMAEIADEVAAVMEGLRKF
jgi:tetratricopeptide (TPR) repeat protein